MLDAVATPQAIFAKDYKPAPFRILRVDLIFDLDPTATRITNQMVVEPVAGYRGPLVLDGDELTLISVAINGKSLTPANYRLTDTTLSLTLPTGQSTIEIITEINPQANTKLMGLYMSGGVMCTQCEAEGFRRITYFLDRPDVLTRYRTTLRANRAAFPILLSNGNPGVMRDLGDGRHEAVWDDPHPKPCYLFAAVAGNLSAYSDQFVTASGKPVALAIWVAEADLDRCTHAMAALKRSMTWDEIRFGREYDLDVFNIVAVGDFNFGAMENKGLNIFNSRYVLAKAETATDYDFDAVEGVIAHEYFHNWTGNRITCRDWFQLSLKEGLTVYRDQEYSAEQGSAALKRIDDVRTLRAAQFPEDGGPLAHPVRPDSYIEISNFYTATVYNKGAEVIRMLATLLGRDGFRRGMDLYFERHDGQAVACEDFVVAMEDANQVDLHQFRLWYAQAGTPQLRAAVTWDDIGQRATLQLQQMVPNTPGQTAKQPMHIPVRAALIGAQSGKRLTEDVLIDVRRADTIHIFENINERPVPSLLRGFSAPVTLTIDITRPDLATLSACDDDPFSRYEAMQKLGIELMCEQIAMRARGAAIILDPLLRDAMRKTLEDPTLDPALTAEAVVLASEPYLGDQMVVVDVEGIHAVRQTFRAELARNLRPLWLERYHSNVDTSYEYTPLAKARRRLKNIALQYLMADSDPEAVALAFLQFTDADNMTDQIAALTALCNSNAVERDDALAIFYNRWKKDPLVLDKWFTLQALSTRPDTLANVLVLTNHPDFTITNPNRLRALVNAFSANQARFHDATGAGYRYLADQVLAVDKINPQSAARLIAPLGRWRRFDANRASKMRQQLDRIVSRPNLSRDVFEIASKSLG